MTTGDRISMAIAVLTALAVGVAAGGVIQQLWLTRLSSTVEQCQRLRSEWSSKEMLAKRKAVATAALKEGHHPSLSEVLNFFDFLGYLVTRRAVRCEAAWEVFSDWALPYWCAFSGYVDAQRKAANDDTYWRNAEALHRRLLNVERKKRRGRRIVEPYPSEREWRRFLQEECDLQVDDVLAGHASRGWRVMPDLGSAS